MTKSKDNQGPDAGANAAPKTPARHAAKPREAGKRATIYDLARLANVSPGTVSRVLNNRDRVKTETREAVLRAAADLNLKPQASVRNREVAILSEPVSYTHLCVCGQGRRKRAVQGVARGRRRP